MAVDRETWRDGAEAVQPGIEAAVAVAAARVVARNSETKPLARRYTEWQIWDDVVAADVVVVVRLVCAGISREGPLAGAFTSAWPPWLDGLSPLWVGRAEVGIKATQPATLALALQAVLDGIRSSELAEAITKLLGHEPVPLRACLDPESLDGLRDDSFPHPEPPPFVKQHSSEVFFDLAVIPRGTAGQDRLPRGSAQAVELTAWEHSAAMTTEGLQYAFEETVHATLSDSAFPAAGFEVRRREVVAGDQGWRAPPPPTGPWIDLRVGRWLAHKRPPGLSLKQPAWWGTCAIVLYAAPRKARHAAADALLESLEAGAFGSRIRDLMGGDALHWAAWDRLHNPQRDATFRRFEGDPTFRDLATCGSRETAASSPYRDFPSANSGGQGHTVLELTVGLEHSHASCSPR